MVSFIKDIITDITKPENDLSRVSAGMRATGALVMAASVIHTVILITNPQFGVPLTVLKLAGHLFDTAFFYDLTRVGLNIRNVEIRDITQETLYKGTLFNKFYSSYKDDELEHTSDRDEKREKLSGNACRIYGTYLLARIAADALLVPFAPIATPIKLVKLGVYALGIATAYDIRKMGENKLSGKASLVQDTLIMKYLLRFK